MKKRIIGAALAVAGSIATFEFLRRKGVVDEVAGQVRQKIGAATNDTGLEIKGVAQEGRGKVRGFFHDLKEGTKDVAENMTKRTKEVAADVKKKASSVATDVKHKAEDILED